MKLWEKNIRKVKPYVPGEQPNELDIIKINTNENPYPPALAVKEALQQIDRESLRLYPDPSADLLIEVLAKNYQVKKEQVFVGVGSDDVLATAFLTFFCSKKPILFPDITYSFYSVWADLFQIPFERPALDKSFHLEVTDYKKENGGIILANPNAPTSIYEELDVIEEIIKYNQEVIVIIDEAYIDFGGKSALSLLPKYDNLLVVQTFSKSRSLAGLRIGYAIANPELIQAMNQVKYSYNSYTLNLPAQKLGAAAIKEKKYFEEVIEKIVKTREWVKKELSQLGFSFPNSQTNFLFVTHQKVQAKDIFIALRENKIYVRYFETARIDNYLRITIGTDEQMERLISFLKSYIK